MNTLSHTIKFFFGLEAPASQVTSKESEVLLKYLPARGVVVELGCFEGSTTALLATNTEATLYSIDPFFSGRLGVSYGEWIAKLHSRRSRTRNVRFLKGFSFDQARHFSESIDFLFVDADHRFEAVQQDWNDWFPKVKAGGIIAMHDSKVAENSPDRLGSMDFYDNFLSQLPKVTEIDGVDSLVVLRKI
ncbi:MAG TPA: class I SAM-dependent methyltransferase [Pyrinomonadaceae bacterium]